MHLIVIYKAVHDYLDMPLEVGGGPQPVIFMCKTQTKKRKLLNEHFCNFYQVFTLIWNT